MKSRPTFIELFSGAGLFGQAFISEGFALEGAYEIDRAAARTFQLNHGDRITVGDIRARADNRRCDVLVGGPPCQGFSTLGKRRTDDPRNALCLEMVRWAALAEPKMVVVENVPAFLDSSAWGAMAEGLGALGYEIGTVILNALDFGVAQIRRRSITFATRCGVPDIKPLHGGCRTVRDAWQGLPERPDSVNSHVAPSPSPLAEARMSVIPYGGDKRDILRSAPDLAPRSWTKTMSEATDVWGRMRWDRPANTLRTAFLNPSKGRYIHPTQNRVISLREGARLQSVPDSYAFAGTPTQIARQIGNGVPVRMGRAIARAVYRRLAS